MSVAGGQQLVAKLEGGEGRCVSVCRCVGVSVSVCLCVSFPSEARKYGTVQDSSFPSEARKYGTVQDSSSLARIWGVQSMGVRSERGPEGRNLRPKKRKAKRETLTA
eukprot:3938619-Rhodomonas_salina.1